MIINITGWSLDPGSITNPPLVRSTPGSVIQCPDQDFFMSEENVGGNGDKVKRDTSGSGNDGNHEFSFSLNLSFIYLSELFESNIWNPRFCLFA